MTSRNWMSNITPAGLCKAAGCSGMHGSGFGPAGAGGGMAGRLRQGLISYWNLQEAAGVRFDAHDGNDLTDNNTVTQRAGPSAVIPFAASFDDANSEYLSHVDNPALSMGDIPFTVAIHALMDDKTAHRFLVTKWNGPANQREYNLYYDQSVDRFRFAVSRDGQVATVSSVDANALGSPSAATWYFLVGWHDPDLNQIYIQVDNGAVNSVAHAGGAFDGTALFTMGCLSHLVTFLDGALAAGAIWKRLLTAAERTWLYNGGLGRLYPF